MTVKKRSMIKKLLVQRSLNSSGVYYFAIGGLESVFAFFLVQYEYFLGFGLGLAAFGVSFFGLEVILGRVFDREGIKDGILDSLFWVVLKFLGPMGLLYFGMTMGLSVWALFFGLLVGLFNVSGILFQRSHFSEKNR